MTPVITNFNQMLHVNCDTVWLLDVNDQVVLIVKDLIVLLMFVLGITLNDVCHYYISYGEMLLMKCDVFCLIAWCKWTSCDYYGMHIPSTLTTSLVPLLLLYRKF